jgi:hypothetical protein
MVNHRPFVYLQETEDQMSTDDECDEAYEASPQDEAWEKKLREAEEEFRSLQASGWKSVGKTSSDRQLAHPDDPEMAIWFDHYTGEKFLSPKYVEHLKRQLRNDRGE